MMTLPIPTAALDGTLNTPAPEPEEASAGEAALVRLVLEGQTSAFDELVRLHSPRVFRFLHQFTRQRQDAEDLTQQTFIKAYRHLGSFELRRPMINWLLTIARRTALNHFRSAQRWEVLPEQAAAEGPSPASAAEARERTENLWDRARAVLPPRQFEVLWLRFGEDLSTEETARVCGLTQTHVKILVYRAKRALAKGVQS
jgi:RNA polymerase sigma-70 factor (ECF subfamily)